jgi:hypothetical protein
MSVLTLIYCSGFVIVISSSLAAVLPLSRALITLLVFPILTALSWLPFMKDLWYEQPRHTSETSFHGANLISTYNHHSQSLPPPKKTGLSASSAYSCTWLASWGQPPGTLSRTTTTTPTPWIGAGRASRIFLGSQCMPLRCVRARVVAARTGMGVIADDDVNERTTHRVVSRRAHNK